MTESEIENALRGMPPERLFSTFPQASREVALLRLLVGTAQSRPQRTGRLFAAFVATGAAAAVLGAVVTALLLHTGTSVPAAEPEPVRIVVAHDFRPSSRERLDVSRWTLRVP